jgi:hypothetical protein
MAGSHKYSPLMAGGDGIKNCSVPLSFIRAMFYFNDMFSSEVSSLSPKCLADGIPFTGLMGLVWRLRGVRRSASNPNLCNR